MSTVSFPPLLNPRKDAVKLHRAFGSVPPDPYSPSFYRAMKVIGCDTAAVVEILARRNETQRFLIQQEYKDIYSDDDLLERLSLELSGNLKTSVLLWMPGLVERDAIVLKQGLSSETKNLQAATEVICSRTPTQIQGFKEQYHFRFGVHLEDDIIKAQASGVLKELLLAYVSTPRCEGLAYDTEIAANDSEALFEAGETDKRTFINIFSERSWAQLAAVISAYRDTYGNSLEKAVKGRKRGLFEYALWTILSCSKNPARYFAKVLHKAMKGVGTDDTTLIRVIVTRTEIDMQHIKAEYRLKYNKTLNDAVHLETCGRYRTFLLTLLGSNR